MCKKIYSILGLLYLLFIPISVSAQWTKKVRNYIGNVGKYSVLGCAKTNMLHITKVGTPNGTVFINGDWRGKHYEFPLTEYTEVRLDKNEYIVVTNRTTGASGIMIAGNDLVKANNKAKKKYLYDFIEYRCACGKGDDGFSKFIEADSWSMVEDTLYIPTQYKQDEEHRFYLRTIPGNKVLKQAVPYILEPESNEMIITKEYLFENNVYFPDNQKLQFRLEYWTGKNKHEVITDKLFIEYIPKY